MEYRHFFFQASIYLLAAVFSVPLAKRLGFGSVLGYLIAGVIVGPFAIGIIEKGSLELMHFSQFGIEMMLFLIGLELRLPLLWRLRTQILGMGVLQVVTTTGIIASVFYLFGEGLSSSLAIGMILSLSSTAIVMQVFTEKGWMKSPLGQSSFSVLLFQDMAFIPMMAVLPLLISSSSPFPLDVVIEATKWQKAFLIMAVVGGMFFFGRFLMRPIFRFIACSRLREIFTATALLLVIANALLMDMVGLSPELGTFLAGVVLAESEYRHELESDIQPFKGLLLGLFFISVGASIDFGIIATSPLIVLKMVLLLVLAKFVILYPIAKLFKMSLRDSLLFGISLAQGGEFCFMLLSYASSHHFLSEELASFLVVAVAVSMMLTPVLIILFERFIEPYLISVQEKKEYDEMEFQENPVIIAGFGRVGQIIGRLLMANNIKATVLDYDSENIESVRRFGFKVFFGDASRMDLLLAAGIEHAKLFILAIDDSDKALQIATSVRAQFPNLKILARVHGRRYAYEFIKNDFNSVYRETLDSSLMMGADALKALGFPEHYASRCANLFRFHDEDNMRRLSKGYEDEQALIDEVKRHTKNLEETFQINRKSDSIEETFDPVSLEVEN